jgi:hypothetical protein
MASHDYAAAAALVPTKSSFPLDFGTEAQLAKATVKIEPLTWSQVLDGERRMWLHVPYGERMMEMDWDICLRAKHFELIVVFWAT